jgi:riboflavin biosynthesis pyrimidine reductase
VTDLDVRLESLFEAGPTPDASSANPIEVAYGGPFELPDRLVYANFVTSVDGVAAIEGIKMSSAAISGGAPADRFVMALLRAAADAVVVGAGTVREHGGPWTAEKAFPPAAEALVSMRTAMSAVGPAPVLVVVTGSGDLPTDHPALDAAIVATTTSGANVVAERGIRCAEVLDLGATEHVDSQALIERLRERGFRRILTEGGPSLMGSMLAADVVDELFLTRSPLLVGGGDGRPPFTGEIDLLGIGSVGRLLGARRSGDYLFLRYALARRTSAAGPEEEKE